MNSLRGLAWPHLNSLTSKTTQSSPSTTSAQITSKPGSFKNLVLQSEAGEESKRRSSGGHCPCTCPLSSGHSSSQFGAPSPVKRIKESQLASQPTGEDTYNSAVSSYLPNTTVLSGKKTGLRIGEHLCPASVSCAVDSAADDLGDLSPIPDTPLGYSQFQFEFNPRPSFNTAIRDLLQEKPDEPIGGQVAAQMESSFKSSNNLIEHIETNRGEDLESPQDDFQSHAVSFDRSRTEPLNSRTNFSHSFLNSSKTEKQSLMYEFPTPMVTAPQSPKACRDSDFSDMSNNSPDISGIVVRDFAPVSGTVKDEAPESSFSPKTFVPQGDGPPPDPCLTTEYDDGVPLPCPAPPRVQNIGECVPLDKLTSCGLSDLSISRDGPDSLPAAVPNCVLNTSASMLGFGSSSPSLGGLMPRDETGNRPPPAIPLSRGKRKAVKKGQRAYRRGRKLFLSKPILSLVVGRQLAGPTSQALRLISQGIPMDANEVKNAVPISAPIATSPIPA